MAEDNDKETNLEIDGGGKKKKILIIIIAVVVLLAGGGGYFFFMGADSVATPEQSGESAEGESAGTGDSAGAELGSALYVPMPRPFR